MAGAVDTGIAASPDQAPAPDPSSARVWFLRELVPGSAMHAPMVYANGGPLALAAEGTAFYHDFAPGNYVFTVENCSPAPQASQMLPLSPGNQFALQVQSNDDAAWCGPMFDLTVPPAEILGYLFSRVSYRGPR